MTETVYAVWWSKYTYNWLRPVTYAIGNRKADASARFRSPREVRSD
jgi:hypothetical protein